MEEVSLQKEASIRRIATFSLGRLLRYDTAPFAHNGRQVGRGLSAAIQVYRRAEAAGLEWHGTAVRAGRIPSEPLDCVLPMCG